MGWPHRGRDDDDAKALAVADQLGNSPERHVRLTSGDSLSAIPFG
jgi:hypothetical protein